MGLNLGNNSIDAMYLGDNEVFRATTVEALNLSGNGTHVPKEAHAYGPVSVNAPGWRLLFSKELTTSTTSTSAVKIDTITVGEWVATKHQLIYMRIRDKAGPRAGHFYGSDTFWANSTVANGDTSNQNSQGRIVYMYDANSKWQMYSGQYGVYGSTVTQTQISIYQRYHASNSLTIDGTYVIEVWALDWPNFETPFAATQLRITKQPANAYIEQVGDQVSFHVETNDQNPTYKWQYKTANGSTWNNTSLSGYNTDTLGPFTTNATNAESGRVYRCVITTSDGTSLVSNEVGILRS